MESIGSYRCVAGVDMDGLDATELRLGLPGTTTSSLSLSLSVNCKSPREVEMPSKSSCCSTTDVETTSCCNDNLRSNSAAAPPPAKSQVVGWPPVQSFRVRSGAASHTRKATDAPSKKEAPAASTFGLLVKVSMDGAPYLRKIDLGSYNGYKDLRMAVDSMFRCFSPAETRNLHNIIMTYEDKEGDWMLVGDVPWEMFASSCKRLRIMKGSSNETRA